MTGLPAALSALALASTASVADSEIAETRAETLVDMCSILSRGDDPPCPPGTGEPIPPCPRGGRRPPNPPALVSPPTPRSLASLPTLRSPRPPNPRLLASLPTLRSRPSVPLDPSRPSWIPLGPLADTRRFDGRAVQTYTAWTDSGPVAAAACPRASGGC